MSYFHHTQVPNILFDIYLKELSESELKVILVIIRQTYGWLDTRTKKPKQWDWISRQFFVKKTSLSLRAVSGAISKLYQKNYIRIKNQDGTLLTTALQRRRAYRLYYSVNISDQCKKQR